jgi:hypothetical protein
VVAVPVADKDAVVALSTIRLLADATEEVERRASNYRLRLDHIMMTIDQGRSIVDAGREAAELLGRGEQWEVPGPSINSEATAANPDDAPYGRRADGTPKARPGRKAKEAPAPAKTPDETDQAKAPIDAAKNAAEIRILKNVLTDYGPCPPSVLVQRSGLDADRIGAHVRAAAVIESYDGEYAMEGGKLMPSIMIRLISQRPS